MQNANWNKELRCRNLQEKVRKCHLHWNSRRSLFVSSISQKISSPFFYFCNTAYIGLQVSIRFPSKFKIQVRQTFFFLKFRFKDVQSKHLNNQLEFFCFKSSIRKLSFLCKIYSTQKVRNTRVSWTLTLKEHS